MHHSVILVVSLGKCYSTLIDLNPTEISLLTGRRRFCCDLSSFSLFLLCLPVLYSSLLCLVNARRWVTCCEQNRTEQHFIEISVKKQSQSVRRQHMGRSIYIPNTVTSKRKDLKYLRYEPRHIACSVPERVWPCLSPSDPCSHGSNHGWNITCLVSR